MLKLAMELIQSLIVAMPWSRKPTEVPKIIGKLKRWMWLMSNAFYSCSVNLLRLNELQLQQDWLLLHQNWPELTLVLWFVSSIKTPNFCWSRFSNCFHGCSLIWKPDATVSWVFRCINGLVLGICNTHAFLRIGNDILDLNK